MALTGMRKMLASIKYQHPRCIGVHVSYTFFLDPSCGDRCHITIICIDSDFSLCSRCSQIMIVLVVLCQNVADGMATVADVRSKSATYRCR